MNEGNLGENYKVLETQEDESNKKELIIKLKQKMRRFSEVNGIEKYLDWKDECNRIINKTYPHATDLERYQLWHVLNGGSGYENEPYFDFSGECSVQKMIEKLPDCAD